MLTGPAIKTCRVERYCGGILSIGCGRVYRVEHWPAAGETPEQVRTHGICDACLAHEVLSLVLSPWRQQRSQITGWRIH